MKKPTSILQKQDGCGNIITKGTPTNGASPFGLGNYSVFLGKGKGRGNFLFIWKLRLLVVLANEDNKCNGLNENQCKSKQVFICNHFTTPFA